MPYSVARPYLDLLRSLDRSDLALEIERPDRLLMASETITGRQMTVAYAPFDHVNTKAKIVIVGLTPGRQQMAAALNEAHRRLRAGADDATTMAAAKVHASFAGPMRANLVAMLDNVGVNQLLGLSTTASLWRDRSDLVHFTSALRYPVFIGGANYSGNPDMTEVPFLKQQLAHIADEMSALRDALFVPLGSKVAKALHHLSPMAGVDRRQILDGLVHPSGANAERIASFLGRKPDELLSPKTNGTAIRERRDALIRQLRALTSKHCSGPLSPGAD